MTEEMKNVTPETAEAPEHVETMEDYKEELEASFKQIHEGDILTGTVIGVSESAITNITPTASSAWRISPTIRTSTWLRISM